MKTNETKVEKNYFNKIFVGVLILHIVFLLIIPGFSKIVIKEPEVSKIPIGLVNQDIDSAPRKEVVETKPEKPKLKPKLKPKPVVVEPVIEKRSLTTTQSFDDLDLMTAIDSPREIPEKGIEEKPNIIKAEDEIAISEKKDIKLNKAEDIPELDTTKNLENVEVLDVDQSIDEEPNIISIKEEEESVEGTEWDTLMGEEDPDVVGVKSGVKVGSVDGESKVVWDPSNKEPVYPLEAEKNAQTADVKIILDVDPSGKVIKVRIVKTGVDAIDRAVESVARDWNIKLINNGMSISGSVMVVYQFKLKGRE